MHPIFKIRPAFSAFAGAVVAAATLVALPSTARAQDDPGYRQYRCTVLGDSQACATPSPTSAVRVEVQTVPGSYARHLMYLGQNADSAIEAARAVGETPIRRTVRLTSRQPSSLEAYQRYLGYPTAATTSYQILAEAPAEPPALQARTGSAD